MVYLIVSFYKIQNCGCQNIRVGHSGQFTSNCIKFTFVQGTTSVLLHIKMCQYSNQYWPLFSFEHIRFRCMQNFWYSPNSLITGKPKRNENLEKINDKVLNKHNDMQIGSPRERCEILLNFSVFKTFIHWLFQSKVLSFFKTFEIWKLWQFD